MAREDHRDLNLLLQGIHKQPSAPFDVFDLAKEIDRSFGADLVRPLARHPRFRRLLSYVLSNVGEPLCSTKAAELVGTETQLQAQNMSPEELEAAKAKIEAELPALISTIIATCAKEDWPDAGRKCVLRAKTLADATKCQ